MIGFVVTEEVAEIVLSRISEAQVTRGLPVFWTTGSYRITNGISSGFVFIPADDDILHTPLRGNPILTPMDFPETSELIELLGGLEGRSDIPPEDIGQ
jgi:hypothetical protein